jgi:hypothetical protein
VMPAACKPATVKATENKPAHVELIAGTELHKVTLTARAAERLDIKTAPVQEIRQAGLGGARIKVVPYSAVLYDAHGATWVYTNPEPLVFVRYRIQIDHISGDRAVLSQGPPVGSAVVTVGAQELFGAEFEIGH